MQDKKIYELSALLVHELTEKKLKIASAESLTGGMVSEQITAVAGASRVFECGICSYSNRIKHELLGVPTEVLEQFTEYSKETAMAMAEGVRKLSGADIGIATTGVAGPDGGTKDKPVGLVFVGCTLKGHTVVKRCFFGGDRQTIRYRAVREALSLLYCQLLADDSEKPVTEDEE